MVLSDAMEKKAPTAAVLIIGNEVLSGRTQDANLAFLGDRLGALGIAVLEARVVRDDAPAIVEALNTLRRSHTYVFTTGGIGPTHDDITAGCVADAFGVSLVQNARALAMLKRRYADADLTPGRLKMANMPEGATLIDNPVSQAPGIRMDNVFVMAGVPAIMRAMFDAVEPMLDGGTPLQSASLTARIGEGVLADPLGRLQQDHRSVEVGSYPYFRGGDFGVTVVVRGTDRAAIDAALADVRQLFIELGGILVDAP